MDLGRRQMFQMIVPTLRVGMQPGTLRVPYEADAERPVRHSHAERGNDLMCGEFDGPFAGKPRSYRCVVRNGRDTCRSEACPRRRTVRRRGT
ncbi:hypothetical protein BK665_20165 [Pseudomonas frederiksbergensis]|uniref:Uncharacterized protein n=1 Tax=Pseudomonas frederiksbergensis TaxID=104087 RepID=A0A423KEM1_9PSED|nr:hypothetical protein BK665_20165 [Pseudomonas frederiksbergensis]